MSKRTLWLIPFVAISALLAWGFGMTGATQTVVESMDMELQVVGAGGLPVTNATVLHQWYSNPYSNIERLTSLAVDAKGRVRTSRKTNEEGIAPLCMHGVRGHGLALCIQAPDHLTVIVDLDMDASDEPIMLRVPLQAGESVPCPTDRAFAHYWDAERRDLSDKREVWQAGHVLIDRRSDAGPAGAM